MWDSLLKVACGLQNVRASCSGWKVSISSTTETISAVDRQYTATLSHRIRHSVSSLLSDPQPTRRRRLRMSIRHGCSSYRFGSFSELPCTLTKQAIYGTV